MTKTPLTDLKKAEKGLREALYFLFEALPAIAAETRAELLGFQPALEELQQQLGYAIEAETEFGEEGK